MAKNMENLTLYVRGMNKSPEDMEDVWDDTVLNCAYDKALKMANEEVAKRIAMETNSNHSGNKSKSNKGKEKAKKEPQKSEAPIVWHEGSPCRAIYEEDGLEYEAFLVKIIDDDDCIVRFLGYDNDERVALSSLKRSLGDAARLQQVREARAEGGERGDDDGFESQLGSESVDLYSDESGLLEPGSHIELPRDKKKKSKSSKKRAQLPNYGDLPTLPTFSMPTANMFRNVDPMDMPFPPPPPMMSLGGRSDAEEQAISDMLLSWYMTGYYTGLYQGMRRQRQSRRHH